MQPRGRGRCAAAPTLPAAVALLGALLGLAACGTVPAPDPGRTPPAATSAPLRPVTDQRTEPDGGLACPASLASADGMTVPAKPQGLDGAARLLPDRPATSLVVCAYPVLKVMASRPLAKPYRLESRTVATPTRRAELVAAMSWAPRWNGNDAPCPAVGGDETAYLVGARYADAVVWVATKADPGGCARSTNGDFVSGAPFGTLLAGDASGGHRRPTVAEESCHARSWGRLGDDRLLAPDGGPTVVVCRQRADGSTTAKALDAGRSAEVVHALRALPTRATQWTCSGSGRTRDSQFTLLLRYAVGPAVSVRVDPDCAPSVMGSNLESDDARDLVELVEQWSPPIPGPDPDGSVSSDGSVAPPVPAVSAPAQPPEPTTPATERGVRSRTQR